MRSLAFSPIMMVGALVFPAHHVSLRSSVIRYWFVFQRSILKKNYSSYDGFWRFVQGNIYSYREKKTLESADKGFLWNAILYHFSDLSLGILTLMCMEYAVPV